MFDQFKSLDLGVLMSSVMAAVMGFAGYKARKKDAEAKERRANERERWDKFVGRIDDVRTKLEKHQLYCAQNFVAKSEIDRLSDNMTHEFRSIRERLDDLITKQK